MQPGITISLLQLMDWGVLVKDAAGGRSTSYSLREFQGAPSTIGQFEQRTGNRCPNLPNGSVKTKASHRHLQDFKGVFS